LWEKLETEVSFEFVDTPFVEAVRFIQHLASVNMVIDPKAVKDKGHTPITLRVQDMPLHAAIKWVVRLAELDVSMEDDAIHIKPKNPDAERKVGQVKVEAMGISLTFEVTEADLPREMRRGILHRLVEGLERQAEREEERAERMRRGPRMDPEQMQNMPEAIRDKMMKMMEKRRRMAEEGWEDDPDLMRRKMMDMKKQHGQDVPKNEVF
jgi:hypothetical protein